MMDRKNPQALWLGGLTLLLGLVLSLAGPLSAGATPGGDYVGTDTCADCHDDQAATFTQSIHGRLQAYQNLTGTEGCEVCHGAGGNHVESEDPADIFNPTADLGNQASAACLTCHTTGHTLDWDMSVHAESDVACTACHQMHGNSNKALLVSKEEDLCFTCHLDMKAKFQLPSHHPLKEGFMTCSTCHDSHGGDYQNIAAGETARDACLNCHPQYAGPFVFEHSPVEEDCTICHDVHGTVANNLLRQNEPFLCLQCHQPHFHSLLAGYEGDYSTPPGVGDADPRYDGLSGTSHGDSMKRVMLTKCTQCHQSVHGSDLPSQSITGQGRALNR